MIQGLAEWSRSLPLQLPLTIARLAGDGSTRTFFRLHDEAGASFILLCDPEWISSQDYPVLQAYLRSVGVRVPTFMEVRPELGFLIMEDLGDELLQNRMAAAPERQSWWLEKAIESLAALHGQSYPVPLELPVTHRRFDTEKYYQELRFTWEHLVDRFLGLSPPTETQQQQLLDFCARAAAVGPDVFCHRDYHCRNLMVLNDALVMIDFQDARLGSPQYDLASLVYDAYVPLTDDQRARLIEHYQRVLEPHPLAAQIHWATFRENLTVVGLQRMVKAAGSFASFYTRHGKTTHLAYIEPALQTAIALRDAGSVPPAMKAVFPLEQWLARLPNAGW